MMPPSGGWGVKTEGDWGAKKTKVGVRFKLKRFERKYNSNDL